MRAAQLLLKNTGARREPVRLDRMFDALHGKPLRQLTLIDGPHWPEDFAADVEQFGALLRSLPALERLDMSYPGRLDAVAELLVGARRVPVRRQGACSHRLCATWKSKPT